MHEILIFLLILFLFGEYIPFLNKIWEPAVIKAKKFGKVFLDKYENKLYKTKEKWEDGNTLEVKVIDNFFLRLLFFVSAFVVVVFIEIFWELSFRKAIKKIEKTSFAEKSKEIIKSLPDVYVLILFGIPFVIMEVIGIFSFSVIVNGYILYGLLLYALKVLLFIPVHFILNTGRDQLMRIAWFRRRYIVINDIFKWFRRSQTYIRVHNFINVVKGYISVFKKRFIQMMDIIKKGIHREETSSEHSCSSHEEDKHQVKKKKD